MRRFLVVCLVLSCSIVQAGQGNLTEGYGYLADRCKDLGCVQQNLQMIDGQIAALVAKRLSFVKRAAQIKNNSVLLQNSLNDAARQN